MPNGTSSTPSSEFLSKLTSYPAVDDAIKTYKSYPLGQKSLDLTKSAYDTFAKPVEPYLQTPAAYAAPYAQKADSLAVSGLDKLETHVPMVKEDTSSLIDRAKSLVWFPLTKAGEAKEYVFSTYNSEYEKTARYKNRGPGLATSAMAVVSTELKVASDFFSAVAEWLGPKYEEGKQSAGEMVDGVVKKGDEWKKAGEEKVGELQKVGQEKKESAAKEAERAKAEAEKKGEEVQGEVKKRSNAK